MDTKFWGPSGWRLLHLITFAYSPIQKESVRKVFESLPYVLPCKFCRASLQEYIEEDPVEPALRSKVTLSKWLWRIHNKVNDKLRGQRLLDTDNPSFQSIKEIYEKRLEHVGSFEGWDFLFSIAENHPYCKASRHSIPMKDCPPIIPLHASLSQKNRWNILSCNERMNKYKVFWENLQESLPFEEWRNTWKECGLNEKSVDERLGLIRELWKLKCCFGKEGDTLESTCKKLADHRSGCSNRKNAKTCRRKRS